MGITGLLPLLKKASKNCHVRKLSGCTVAIDAYCWLHKGSFGCAEKLGKGEPTDAYITYCMKYIQVLLDNKIKPILVLDGRNLPSKAHTEKKRREKREENRKLARKYLQEGRRKEAWECFTRCVDITPAMARAFIKRLRSLNIDYVVAPHEADAQLAYLAKTGIADVIITEDSDLVLFGCPKIFFKMNVNGDGVLFDQSKLPQCLGLTADQFVFEQFRWMCILSGCDYLASLPGIGLGRAKKVIDASNHTDIRQMLMTISGVLDKVQVDVTEEYIAGFIQAENTFLYQLVFDTATRTVIPLNPYPDSITSDSVQYAGKYENHALALGMALGNVDIHSLETVDDFEPMKSKYPPTSIWSKSFKAEPKMITADDAPKVQVGMQISTLSSSASTNKKQKRPLAVANNSIVDNTPGDMELMSMYSESSISIYRREKKESATATVKKEIEDDQEFEFSDEYDSPSSTAKRRRITQTKPKTEAENGTDNSPSCNTRSRRRTLPFFKSPENSRVHVKSQYFRSESEERTEKVNTEIKNSTSPSQTETKFTGKSTVLRSSLSIYSNSQSTNFTDVSASQSSTFSQASSAFSSNGHAETEEDLDDPEFLNNSIEVYASPNGKDKKTTNTNSAALITLDDDEEEDEDEAYESMGITTVTKSLKVSSISNVATRSSSSYTSSPYFENSSKSTGTNSSSQVKTTRRQGLSRAVKKVDPKQRSVKDMFVKQTCK